MQRTIGVSILFIAVSLTAFTPRLFAQETVEGATEETQEATPIVVNGDKVQYDHGNKRVIGTGNVTITYKNITLTCDKIEVDLERKEGAAEGNVRLYQDGNIFTADSILYNFEKKKGQLLEGGMKMAPWYGKAHSIEKVGDKEYHLKKSYVTTCELEKPHYRIEARTIKVYLDDRVTAWHVYFYVGDIPVMYAPYYNHPLKDNLPQVTIVPGHNDEWGTFLLTSWRYFFHPDSKGHIHLDYRTRRGLAEGFDYKYGLRKFGSGYFRYYYMDDDDPGLGMDDTRWRVLLRHRWDIDKNTLVIGEYHRLSDQDFIKDFFYKEEYERENQPSTYVTLVGAKENYLATILYRKKVNKFFDVVERLPEAKLNIRKLKLFNHLNLYYKNESSGVYLNQSYANDVSGASPGDSYDAMRLDTYNELSYPFQAFGFLSLNPFIASRQTFYSQDAMGNDNITRHLFTGGLDLYARVYKIYDVETDFMNLNINKLRHLVIPSARWSYTREPKVVPEELLIFDSIDTLRRKDSVELSIQHKLQTKKRDKDGSEHSVDLLNFIISSEYIFLDDFGIDNKLMDIEYDLEVRPYSWMRVDADARLDREQRRFDTFNIDLNVNRGEDFGCGLGYRYERHENSQLAGRLSYHVNRDNWRRHWAFSIYERYEFQEKRFQEMEYTIVKDLHCWLGELTCRIEDQKDFTFWLIFRLKAFPDLPFFFRTKYYGPEPGSKRY